MRTRSKSIAVSGGQLTIHVASPFDTEVHAMSNLSDRQRRHPGVHHRLRQRERVSAHDPRDRRTGWNLEHLSRQLQPGQTGGTRADHTSQGSESWPEPQLGPDPGVRARRIQLPAASCRVRLSSRRAMDALAFADSLVRVPVLVRSPPANLFRLSPPTPDTTDDWVELAAGRVPLQRLALRAARQGRFHDRRQRAGRRCRDPAPPGDGQRRRYGGRLDRRR